MTGDFLSETVQVTKQWSNIFKVINLKNLADVFQ